MIIKTKNNQYINVPSSYLANSVSVAGTTIPVKNNDDFTNQWALQIGEIGEERTEIKMISAVGTSGTTVTTSALDFSHPVDTPVYNLKYDQLVFKRSTTGTAGIATAIANGTVSITPNDKYTQFDDTAGSTTYAYKTCYRNSVTAVQSSDSGWITNAGYDQYSLASIRGRSRNKMNMPNVEDDTLDEYINEWLEVMTNAVIEVNQDYAIGTTSVAFSGTTQEGTITAADFVYPRRVWFQSGNTSYEAQFQYLNSFSPNEQFSNTNPYFYFKGDNIIGRNPNSGDATALIEYYKLNTTLSNDTDTLPMPMRGWSKSFSDYAVAQSLYKDNKIEEAERWETKAYSQLNDFKVAITPRDRSGYEYVQDVNKYGSNNDVWW